MSTYIRLTDYKNSEEKKKGFFKPENRHTVKQDDFKKIPGSPIAYWVSQAFVQSFSKGSPIGDFAKKGLSCSGTEIFYRIFWEIDISKTSILSGKKWFPITKGGSFRKWYGNNENLINWENDGDEIKYRKNKFGNSMAVIRAEEYYFKEGTSWNDVSSGIISFRYTPEGSIPTDSGPVVYSKEKVLLHTAFFNSCVSRKFTDLLCPTIHFGVGQVAVFPIIEPKENINDSSTSLIFLARTDWDSFETSWDFNVLPVISDDHKGNTVETSYNNWREFGKAQISEMKELEEENNKIFIDAYELQDELTPDVPIEQITLTANPAYRYGKGKTDEAYKTLFRTDSMKELISYSIGCMMGRYSLDEKGLVYAHSGNINFDQSKYKTFPADDDGIIPLTDMEWFPDDATNRFEEFIRKVWDKKFLQENLKFVADCLSPKSGETPVDTIRRYISTKFFEDHTKRYKKRPIYWLFSSGKEKAFEALVYLHRYNESTLARMRSEYVNPLQSKMNGQISRLTQDAESTSTTSEKRRIEKEIIKLNKKVDELAKFDEQLKHHADQRISIDLDDGVKVNYGKFGNLLADVKKITGKK